MRKVGILLFSVLFALSLIAVDYNWMKPTLGDARLGGEWSVGYTNLASVGMVDLPIPYGEHDGITVTMWLRLTTSSNTTITTGSFICPEAVQSIGDDILDNALLHGSETGTNINGAVSFPELTFSDYETKTNLFDGHGVYTIDGWSSNTVTISVGGNESNVGPGEFNQNIEAGITDGVIVTGTGPVSIGISRCNLHRFYGFVDGVREDEELEFTNESIITNEIKFASYRYEIDSTNIIYRSDLADYELCNPTGITVTNDLNAGVSKLSSNGIYRFGCSAFNPAVGENIEFFDIRIFGRRLDDDEIIRIHDNGVEEIERRNIPRWK